MYLWRGLPDGQLLAVLRWIATRRDRPASPGLDSGNSVQEPPALKPTDETRLEPR